MERPLNVEWKFVAARSPQGLQRLMRVVTRRKGFFVPFERPSFSNGRWFAWYKDELNLEEEFTRDVSEIKEESSDAS